MTAASGAIIRTPDGNAIPPPPLCLFARGARVLQRSAQHAATGISGMPVLRVLPGGSREGNSNLDLWRM